MNLAVVTPRGPTLNGIVGRLAGIISNYRYPGGVLKFSATGAIWDRDTLIDFSPTRARSLTAPLQIRQTLKFSDYVYVLESGGNKYKGPASEFSDLKQAFWIGQALPVIGYELVSSSSNGLLTETVCTGDWAGMPYRRDYQRRTVMPGRSVGVIV